jgi:hypothetical protein
MNPTTFESTLETRLWSPSRIVRLRALLLVVCIVAAAVGFVLGYAVGSFSSDVELVRLLRGMAVAQGIILLAVLALLSWRLRWLTFRPLVVSYATAVGVMSFASALVWQLTFIGVAAFLFHASLLALLVLILRDDVGRARMKARLNAGRLSGR